MRTLEHAESTRAAKRGRERWSSWASAKRTCLARRLLSGAAHAATTPAVADARLAHPLWWGRWWRALA